MHHRLLAAAMCAALPAAAQTTPEVNLSLFRPAAGSEGTLAVEGAQTIPEGTDAVEAMVGIDAAFNPVRDASARVRRRIGGWVGIQGRLDPSISVLVQVPVTLEQSSLAPVGLGPGDVRVGLRAALGRAFDVDFGALAALDLATSQEHAFTGDARVGGELLVAASWQRARFRLLGNLYARFRPPRDLGAARFGNEIGLRAAATYGFRPWLTPFLELDAQTSLRALSVATAPLEWRLGARACALRWLAIDAGIGTRLDAALGAPDARVVLLLRYAPSTCTPAAAPAKVDESALATEISAARERQAAARKLAEEAERERQRRETAELLASETHGAETNARGKAGTLRGAEEKDSDGDGLPDVRDNCPAEPGPVLNRGCPLSQRQLVQLREARIEILEKVFFAFASSRIEKRSFKLLDQVAALLKSHPDLLQLQVEGYTDNIGGQQANTKLSLARARAVANYLTRRGIEAARLLPRGFGPARPLAPNLTARGREQNRRVEFRVVRRRAGDLILDEPGPQ